MNIVLCKHQWLAKITIWKFQVKEKWSDPKWHNHKPYEASLTPLFHNAHWLVENCVSILGFHQSVIKTKNRNHSMNKVKNLGCDRWLINKKPRQESGLCCFSFVRYLQKCVIKIYRALYMCVETPCLCPSEGHKHGGHKVKETSVTEFCYWNEKLLL